MKLKINKKAVKSLSPNNKQMSEDMTPQVAGGKWWTEGPYCGWSGRPRSCQEHTCQIP